MSSTTLTSSMNEYPGDLARLPIELRKIVCSHSKTVDLLRFARCHSHLTEIALDEALKRFHLHPRNIKTFVKALGASEDDLSYLKYAYDDSKDLDESAMDAKESELTKIKSRLLNGEHRSIGKGKLMLPSMKARLEGVKHFYLSDIDDDDAMDLLNVLTCVGFVHDPLSELDKNSLRILLPSVKETEVQVYRNVPATTSLLQAMIPSQQSFTTVLASNPNDFASALHLELQGTAMDLARTIGTKDYRTISHHLYDIDLNFTSPSFKSMTIHFAPCRGLQDRQSSRNRAQTIKEILRFNPELNVTIVNPDTWLESEDVSGGVPESGNAVAEGSEDKEVVEKMFEVERLLLSGSDEGLPDMETLEDYKRRLTFMEGSMEAPDWCGM